MNDQQVIERLRSAIDEVVADTVTIEAMPARQGWRSSAAVRLLGVAAATVALIGAGVWVVVASDAEPDPAPSADTSPAASTAPVVTSPAGSSSSVAADVDQPLLVGGIVRTPDGSRAAGARVEVLADPVVEVKEGERYELVPIAEVRTDADGAFEVRVSPRALRPHRIDGRFVELTVVVNEADGFIVGGFSRALRRNGSLVREEPEPDVSEVSVAPPLTVPATGISAPDPPSPRPEPAPPPVIYSVVDGAPHLDMTLVDEKVRN